MTVAAVRRPSPGWPWERRQTAKARHRPPLRPLVLPEDALPQSQGFVLHAFLYRLQLTRLIALIKGIRACKVSPRADSYYVPGGGTHAAYRPLQTSEP